MKTQTTSTKNIYTNTRLRRIAWLDLGAAVLMGSLLSLHPAEVVGWGANDDGQTSVPPGLNNVVGIAGGKRHSMALRRDGTVVSWGDQTYVPAGLNSVVAIAAGGYNLALRTNGRVTAWTAQQVTPVPADWTNVVAIATHAYGEPLALRADGTVVAWSTNPSSATSLPAGLRHVVAIASGNGGIQSAEQPEAGGRGGPSRPGRPV